MKFSIDFNLVIFYLILLIIIIIIKQSAIITSEDKNNNIFRIENNNIDQTSKKPKRRISKLFLGLKYIFSNKINDVNESNQLGARISNNNDLKTL